MPTESTADRSKDKLNRRQRLFAEEYLKDFNATRSAIAAGYSKHTARTIGHELLTKPDIQQVLAVEVQAVLKDIGVQRDSVLRELAILCFADPDHYSVDDAGNVTLSETAPSTAMRAVSSIKKRVRFTKEGDRIQETELRLWSKTEALKMMGQYFKLYVDKVMPVNPDGETPYDGGSREAESTRKLIAELQAALDDQAESSSKKVTEHASDPD